ncbi:uncharacterized protein LOC131879594 [Tigriopus californicus]|uniref:uncharacterized protein LOC131879594 n=1 Tax=Tigriopus californicus TaxID=6832 RepID=UPI0027DA1266|nr:uncharacterized protein LOC131879594 [Tigriopus californicus]
MSSINDPPTSQCGIVGVAAPAVSLIPSPSPSAMNLRPPALRTKLGSLSQDSRDSHGSSLGDAHSLTQSASGSTARLNPIQATINAHSAPDMEQENIDLDLPYRPLRSYLQPHDSYDSATTSPCFRGSHESVKSERLPSGALPMTVLAARPRSSGVIRQHSQPETCLHICTYHKHHHHHSPHLGHESGPTATRPHTISQAHSHGGGGAGEGIASIAADTLRINGALKQFKQLEWDPKKIKQEQKDKEQREKLLLKSLQNPISTKLRRQRLQRAQTVGTHNTSQGSEDNSEHHLVMVQ